MPTSVPKFRLAYVAYSLLLAAAFLFSAWKAIETDVELIQSGPTVLPGLEQPNLAQPKDLKKGAHLPVQRINSSEREKMFLLSKEIRKLESRLEGKKISDLLLLEDVKEMLSVHELKLQPLVQVEKGLPKTPFISSAFVKQEDKSLQEPLSPYPAKIDIPDYSRTSPSSPTGHRIFPGEIQVPNQTDLSQGIQVAGIMTCYQAFNLQCGQIVSGTNIFQDTVTTYLRDCSNNVFYQYRGVVWHRLVGTGDQLQVKASSTGDYAEMHLYTGSCDTLNCIGGVYNIQSGEKVITTNTIPGKDYFIMLGNYNILFPNMTYQLKVECCSNNPLFYSPPNNFDSTHVLIARTNSTITANNKIGYGASIIYNGAQGVQLNPGFEVAKQATFQIDVNGCLIVPNLTDAAPGQGNNIPPPEPSAPLNKINAWITEEIKGFQINNE